jgi:WXG100 family type VII secretion target
MTQFGVVVAQVDRAATAAGTASDDLLAEIDRLRGEAQDVLAGRWLGAVAARFDQAWTRWDADAHAVVRALDELAEALRLSARDYANCDAAGAEQLRIAW